MIFCSIGFLRQHGKVNDALIQFFCNLFRVAAGNMIMQTRVRLFESSDCGGEVSDLVRFRQTEVNIAAQNIIKARNSVVILSAIFIKSSARFRSKTPSSVSCMLKLWRVNSFSQAHLQALLTAWRV